MLYDFIIVGGGPSGAALASRLSHTSSRPSILLLEAGKSHNTLSNRLLADRFTTLANTDLNWGYQTAPQAAQNGKVTPYNRGKGLGGSSLINFAMWTTGSRDDYDEWARQVGDDDFSWKRVRERFDRIEDFVADVPEEYKKYVNASANEHGKGGPVKVEIARQWEKGFTESLDALYEAGLEPNSDNNSGNLIGVGVSAGAARNGVRDTAASAYLQDILENLEIRTDATVTKVIFDGTRAVGVEANGEKHFAAKEVVLSAGAVDSPKLLLLSGVGPEQHLAEIGIALIKDLPVGENLHDHALVPLIYQQPDGFNDRAALLSDSEAMAAAREQFLANYTGPFGTLYNSLILGYLKTPGLSETDEFKALPEEVQEHLRKPTVPDFELMGYFPNFAPNQDRKRTWTCYVAELMNPQAKGHIRLASANPSDDPIVDPNLFNHPYDKASMIKATRKVMDLVEAPAVAKTITSTFFAPKSMTDEDIWQYIQIAGKTTWHPAASVKMGKPEDPETCVDSSFRLLGLEKLRVVDMSAVPFLPSCHPVSVAYLLGETAADKMIDEYGLNTF